jgi:SAM-dependent methyltransferase
LLKLSCRPSAAPGIWIAAPKLKKQYRGMNWTCLRHAPWLDTRARFVTRTTRGGNLLDVGSSDGSTLRHFAELRPDLNFYSTDLAGAPEHYPRGCQFHRGDLQKDKVPWPDASMDAITCMHVVEHLNDLTLLCREVARLLKPGASVYFETPHPKTLTLSSPSGKAAGTFTMNFYDDLTHVRPVSAGGLAQGCRAVGLEICATGISRNWLFAASYPFFFFLPASRKKFTARIHWIGWSAFLVTRKPL